MANAPIKDIAKNALMFFAVGVAVAFAAPVIAHLIGAHLMGAGMAHAATSMADAMWTGVVFSAFGGIHTAVAPVFDYLFGDKAKASEKEACCDKKPSISINLSPEQEQKLSQAVGNFAERVQSEKANLTVER